MKSKHVVYKICFSSFMIVFYIILSRFFSIPYMFGLSFFKLSIASSVITFSSFYLGPLFGFIVGTLGDIIGALAFPQGEFNILFTIAASLNGIMPYLIYKLLTLIKYKEKFPILLTLFLYLIPTLIIIFLLTNNELYSYYSSKSYELTPLVKGLIIGICFLLSTLFLIGTIVLKKKFKNVKFNKNYNIYFICLSVFLTFILFKVPISSLIFMYVYELDFYVVFITRLILGFMNSFIDILISSIMLTISLKFMYKGSLTKEEKEIINE